ncbi:MAG: hypothetical protein KDD37_09800, partial [Bdellovibrionales bacterium]|nr:hypothetical protein [Bdellovibrionales bacterium]
PSDWINKYGCREDLGRCGFPFPVNAQKKILLSEDSPQAGGVMRIKPVSTFDGMLNYFADTALLHGTEGQLVYSSISKCPNDFGVDNKAYFPMGRCKATSAGAHLQFKVIEQQDVGSLTERDLAGWCILIKDKTYYFNTTVYDGFMDGMLPLTPGARCDADTCGIIGGSLYD